MPALRSLLALAFLASSAPAQTNLAPMLPEAHWIEAPFSTPQDGTRLDASRPMPIFRRAFTLAQKPTQATLILCGLGQYEVQLNALTPFPNRLAPAWTDYTRTVPIDTYDVTPNVISGQNTLEVLLGNGMYNIQPTLRPDGEPARYTKLEKSFGPPKLIAELRLTFPDGTHRTIPTDASWQTAPGPITFSSPYGGEDYDARRSNPTAWQPAQLTDGPGGVLTPAIAPPVTAHERHQPAAAPTQPRPGILVYDLAQNFAGWPEVTVRGPAGATLRLTAGELLVPDGTVSQKSSGSPQWFSYTLAGSPTPETWHPRFSIYGFRFLQAEWTTPAPGKILKVEGIAIHSAAPTVGTFESSSNQLNRIHKLILEALHNNSLSLFTDCPHREKLGWLEETHLVAPALLYNNALAPLFAATEHNIADAQLPSGLVPSTVPKYTIFGGDTYNAFDDSPEWGSASILAPWAAFRFTGDLVPLAAAYPTMQRFLAYLAGRAAPDGIVAYGLGDWYDIGPDEPGTSQQTTLGVTATLMLFEDAQVMQKIATLLNHPEDAAQAEALATRTAAAFNHRFFHPETGLYDRGSQTAGAMPLALGIVPESSRPAVLAHVIDDIHAHQDHVTTGEIGYPYLLRALMQAGRSDVILAMLLRNDPPSYGSQLAAGATALTEAWDANPADSQDHFMLGAAEEWFYRGLAGIDIDQSRPAPTRITLRPSPNPGIDWVHATFASTLGPIRSDWHREAQTLHFHLTVPTESTLILPTPPNTRITETSASPTHQPAPLTQSPTETTYLLPPGDHHFTLTPSATHTSAPASALALAPLVVIPEGNLLLPLPSFLPKGISVSTPLHRAEPRANSRR